MVRAGTPQAMLVLGRQRSSSASAGLGAVKAASHCDEIAPAQPIKQELNMRTADQMPEGIRLEQTHAALYLFVPFPDNARAKSIEGRKWDRERKAWAFPRTAAAFDAIIAEFGAEIDASKVSRPSGQRSPRPLPSAADTAADSLRRENDALRADISALRASIEKAISSAKQNDETAKLRTLLLKRDTEIALLRQDLGSSRTEVQDLDLKCLRLKEDVRNLKEARALEAVANSRQKASPLTERGLSLVRRFVAENLRSNSSFHSRVETLGSGEMLSIEIGKVVERELTTRLGEYDKRFVDLIKIAYDTEQISSEGKDYAHIIRHQRNKMSHPGAAPDTYERRGALSFIAASLLWSDFDQ
jgi:hypothetical protein